MSQVSASIVVGRQDRACSHMTLIAKSKVMHLDQERRACRPLILRPTVLRILRYVSRHLRPVDRAKTHNRSLGTMLLPLCVP